MVTRRGFFGGLCGLLAGAIAPARPYRMAPDALCTLNTGGPDKFIVCVYDQERISLLRKPKLVMAIFDEWDRRRAAGIREPLLTEDLLELERSLT